MSYVGDLKKHKKQLEDVNSTLTEELQGLSKIINKYVDVHKIPYEQGP